MKEKVLELNKRREQVEEGIYVLNTGVEVVKEGEDIKLMLDTKEGKYVVPMDFITAEDLYAQLSDIFLTEDSLDKEDVKKILGGKIVEVRVGGKGFDLVIEKDGKKYCLEVYLPWGCCVSEET